MKIVQTATVLLLSVSATVTFAGTPQKVGAWTIYSGINMPHHRSVALIQSESEESQNAPGQAADAPLANATINAICAQGQVIAVAVTTSSPIAKEDVNTNGGADTTRVSFSLGDEPPRFEDWAVLDHGNTLSPYAEVFQGRRTKEWIDRLAGSDKLVLQLPGEAIAQPLTLTFRTEGFANALTSAGCPN